MTNQELLKTVGSFSTSELLLFEKYAVRKIKDKDTILLNEGDVCRSLYFILSGSAYQYKSDSISETIIDLHLAGEWIFNQQSLALQIPSETILKTYTECEVIELTLPDLHSLIAQSSSFLALGSIIHQQNHRTYIFDNTLNPREKYDYIIKSKPLLTQTFPMKMIASYLKITPETLSRVRADF